MVLSGDTGCRLIIIGIHLVQFKRQMIEFHIHAFKLIRLSRVRPFTKPALARILSAVIPLVLKMNMFPGIGV